MKSIPWIRQISRKRQGLSQVEVAVSTLIVGTLMVASLTVISASRRSQIFESNRVRGQAIASAMMSEIAQLPLRDPSCDCGFGLGDSESGPTRSRLDDVDDYRGWVDSPAKSKSGAALTGYSDLSRKVEVDHVTTADWGTTSGSYTGIYRVTVIVLRGTKEVCRLVGYRTSGSRGTTVVTETGSLN